MDSALDFTVASSFDNVWSVDAAADVSGTTLEVAMSVRDGSLPMTFSFASLDGSLTIHDSAGQDTVVQPTSDPVAVSVDFLLDATLTLTLTFDRAASLGKTPHPPSTNTVVIKPVPTCPPD
jgi:hypothetical protein